MNHLLFQIQERIPEPAPRGFRVLPESASSIADRIDLLYFYMVVVTGLATVGIFLGVLYFAIRYRRRSEDEVGRGSIGNVPLEIVWSVIPGIFFLSCFAWGAWLYVDTYRPPADAMEIYGVGKQWMWKFWQPNGRGEINTLHVPVGRPVRVRLASEDVIHSFFIPDFRVKMDVVPGRYTTAWFEATKEGEYHLFCAEYCGAKHSYMRGKVVVLSPRKYQEWLEGESAGTLAEQGEMLYSRMGCENCHRPDAPTRAPELGGLFGSEVMMEGGTVVTVDEAYIRESLMEPRSRIVAGYQPIMPSYEGQLDEEEILAIIAYIRSLHEEQ